MRIGKTWSFPECNFTLLFPGEPVRSLSREGSAGDVTKDVVDCLLPLKASDVAVVWAQQTDEGGGKEIEFIYSFASLQFFFDPAIK